ncbi:hypothetical protein FACS1894151_08140 [Spirochaetia bacterium]|nr:hypothetical protein FACS1894151_08140 [Spirochaetia bacterium]
MELTNNEKQNLIERVLNKIERLEHGSVEIIVDTPFKKVDIITTERERFIGKKTG